MVLACRNSVGSDPGLVVIPTAFVSHHDCARHDTGWGHPEHQGRLPALVRAVYRDMLTLHDHLLQAEARPAAEDDLLLVHTPEYLREVREAVERAEAAGRPLSFQGDVVVSDASWNAALAAAGAGITAVETVLAGEARNAFCATRPPGRDAAADRAGGHSLFNTVAVAAAHLRERRGVERVLVVDWGARAPLGTPEILSGVPGARLVSVHRQAPAALPPEAHAVGVPAGTGGVGFGQALGAALKEAVSSWAPDFVLLSLGLDVLSADPLGGLAVEPPDVHGLTRQVAELAERHCGGRLVSVLEGGYHPQETGRAVVQHLRALAGLSAA